MDKLTEERVNEAIAESNAILRHSGMIVTKEENELAKKCLLGEISEKEFIKICYERATGRSFDSIDYSYEECECKLEGGEYERESEYNCNGTDKFFKLFDTEEGIKEYREMIETSLPKILALREKYGYYVLENYPEALDRYDELMQEDVPEPFKSLAEEMKIFKA